MLYSGLFPGTTIVNAEKKAGTAAVINRLGSGPDRAPSSICMYAAPLALALAVHAAPSARPHAAVRVPLSPAPSLSRRQLAASGLLVPAALALGAGVSPASAAADVAAETASLPVYFGCGCFWHVQHEFVDCERQVLGRKDAELTSRCGYAGGLKTGDGGKVCYHNLRRDSDYGKLGHAEAVAMRIPPSKLPDFAKLYFSLFVPYKFPGMTVLERNDPQDAGPEYRSLLGLPGGVKSPLFPAIEAAAQGKWKLVEVRSPPRCPDARPDAHAHPPRATCGRRLSALPLPPCRSLRRGRATSPTPCSSAPST